MCLLRYTVVRTAPAFSNDNFHSLNGKAAATANNKPISKLLFTALQVCKHSPAQSSQSTGVRRTAGAAVAVAGAWEPHSVHNAQRPGYQRHLFHTATDIQSKYKFYLLCVQYTEMRWYNIYMGAGWRPAVCLSGSGTVIATFCCVHQSHPSHFTICRMPDVGWHHSILLNFLWIYMHHLSVCLGMAKHTHNILHLLHPSSSPFRRTTRE